MPARAYVLLFCTCFAAYALVFHGGSWNSTSRFALTLSIVRFGTVTIDEFAALTGDKAEALGHFVSDKAPGMSLLALPSTAAADRLLGAAGGNGELVTTILGGRELGATPAFGFLLWVATVATSGLFSALAVVAFCDLLIRLGARTRMALGFAFVFGLGTLQWGWSATFFGHATAGAFLVLALWAIVRLSDTAGATRLAFAGAAGLFAGSAFLTEFPTAIAGLLLALFALWRVARDRPRQIFAVVCFAIIGAATPLFVLALYNEVAFGNPLHLSYASVVGFEGMSVGLFGIGMPRPDVLYEIVFGGLRGIIWFVPVLIVLPLAMVIVGKRQPDVAIVSVAIVAAFFLINAGYFYWDGGWSTGPRHVVPALGFLVLPIALAAGSMPRWALAALAALACVGILANLIAASTDMFTRDDAHGVILFSVLFPDFLAGDNSKVVFAPLIGIPVLATAVYAAIVGVLGAATFASLTSMEREERPSAPQTELST